MKVQTKIRKAVRNSNLKWTFMDHKQQEVVVNAMLDQSYSVIRSDTKYSDGQIAYALSKYKRVHGLPKAVRTSWRDGTSPLVRQVKSDLMAVLCQEVRDSTPKLILHPTPQTVNV